MGPLIGNCPYHVNKNLIWCAKVFENMICYLILISNFAKKMILHTNYLPNVSENLGSNLRWVAQLIYNILENWPVSPTSQKCGKQLKWFRIFLKSLATWGHSVNPQDPPKEHFTRQPFWLSSVSTKHINGHCDLQTDPGKGPLKWIHFLYLRIQVKH